MTSQTTVGSFTFHFGALVDFSFSSSETPSKVIFKSWFAVPRSREGMTISSSKKSRV